MSRLTPYLPVRDARQAMAWYTRILGAEVVSDPTGMHDGRSGHVELEVDGARWKLVEELPEIGMEAPDAVRGAAITLHLTVDDVDATVARAAGAGARLDRGTEDDDAAGRTAVFRDPFGHRWCVGTPADEGTFDRLLASWNDAIVANDADAIAAFAEPGWVFVGENGIVEGARFLDSVAAGRVTHDHMTSRVHHLRLHGDVAVVVARVRNSGAFEGTPFALDEWSTDVFVARDGRWRCSLTHLTPAAR